jgi:spermidine synthase
MSIFLAALVGFWSLCGQFILNRIIFFYVANSEYAAASIISLHLLGFLLGSLAAPRFHFSIAVLTAASLAVTVLAQMFLWTWGVTVFGLVPTLSMALVFALALAFFSGFLVVRLMEGRPSGMSPTPIIVSDSAGSVLGAMVGGFVLIPKFGLQASFTLMILLQAGALLLITRRQWKQFAFSATAACLACLLMFPGVLQSRTASDSLIFIQGLPLESVTRNPGLQMMFERRSPYGVISVLGDDTGYRFLNIDNRGLCHTHPNNPRENHSEWQVGAVPAVVAQKNGSLPEVAIIGLGCGTTLAAVLSKLPEGARVDQIEINPEMPEAQKLFYEFQTHRPDDPRVNMIIQDGFTYFADLPADKVYDAVVIDLAWMQNMNATHLFSKEMYENIARHMTDRAMLGVWSEEGSPFSPVSLILYRTLKTVFQEVRVDASHGVILFYAAKAASPDLVAQLPEQSQYLTAWMEGGSRDIPINRLDDLVMNRHKFTLWGDSNFDRLREKYAGLKASIDASEATSNPVIQE